MEMSAKVKSQPRTTAQGRYTIGSVSTKDGSFLKYRQVGHGPGVVIVHGAMETSQSHVQLAEALADTFTVYLPDRRGRGLSGPHGANYSIQEEVDDLDALMTHTGAHAVFGVSAGGLISLQAALTLPTIHKVALFEPALLMSDAKPLVWLKRYDREMAQGKVAAALVTAMKGAQMGPAIFTIMPRWLLESLTSMAMTSEEKKGSGDNEPMRALAPTLHDDFLLVSEMRGTVERFSAMRVETLLLGGSKSPAYLKTAVDALEKVLPQSKRVEFPGLDHGASGNTDRGGKPELVARELRRFFA